MQKTETKSPLEIKKYRQSRPVVVKYEKDDLSDKGQTRDWHEGKLM